jgi:hypothetical protein
MRRPSVRRVLTTRLARAIVVGLLLLIALPFTAPFSTCDLNTGLQTGFDEAAGAALSDKMANDTAVPVFGLAVVALMLGSVEARRTSPVSFDVAPQATSAPLRL